MHFYCVQYCKLQMHMREHTNIRKENISILVHVGFYKTHLLHSLCTVVSLQSGVLVCSAIICQSVKLRESSLLFSSRHYPLISDRCGDRNLI